MLKKNGVYQFKTLLSFKNIVHGISTIKLGNMDYRYGDRGEVRKKRQHFFDLLGISSNNTIEMDQVHGTNTVVVGRKNRGEIIPKTDSLITNHKKVFLLIKVADCLPIIFFDPQKKVIAVCHAGFLGTIEKIFFYTVFSMIKTFNCQLDEILIFIGPSICPKCFTIRKKFLNHLPEWQKFIKKKKEKISVDFKNFAIDNLKKIGMPPKNLHLTSLCPFENEDFYSHRRSKQKGEPEGRFLTVVGLR